MNAQGPSAGKRKKFRVEFSATGLFFVSVGAVFLLGWIFVLGIMVGRGFVPESVRSLGQMTEQLSRLVTILGSDRERSQGEVAGTEHPTRLEFYDHLARTAPDLPAGTRRGKIPAAKPSSPEPVPSTGGPPQSIEAEKSGWVVQVASLDNEAGAVDMAEKLKAAGYPAYTYRAVVKGTAFHRVRCGPFESRAEAERAKRLLAEKEKINAFLTTMEQ